MDYNNEKLNFLHDEEKIELLKKANNALNLSNSNLNKIIFIYSHPKVGSTSLVTSIRIFASHIYNVIHIHDENMLKKLTNLKNLTINELIIYNKFLGKEIFVIDVYRSPIERKISIFFEKIDTLHFNYSNKDINNFNIEKIINRFNKIFPYIGNGDQFIDNYNINIPISFDYTNKYLNLINNGINYIKLRLKDSDQWGIILSKLLNVRIKVIKDYETKNKEINNTYLKFKEVYKIPINFLEDLDNCKYLNYFYSDSEKNEYFSEWSNRVDKYYQSFSLDDFKLYEYICNENKHHEEIQSKHYLDEGCLCKACFIKRSIIANKIMRGEEMTEPVIHEKAKNEYIIKKIDLIKKKRIEKIKNLPLKENKRLNMKLI